MKAKTPGARAMRSNAWVFSFVMVLKINRYWRHLTRSNVFLRTKQIENPARLSSQFSTKNARWFRCCGFVNSGTA
jgi:hypothetical protein